jgi:phosphoserine aminotransferase
MSRRADEKSAALYAAIDQLNLYRSPVHPSARSRMNVPFFLAQDALNAPFLEGAQAQGLLQLKGHKSVGGMRASLYNAVELQAVQALIAHMTDFERRHG